jgi:hypothetical protein
MSREALKAFIFHENIAVLLCGHTLVPSIKPRSLTYNGKTTEYLEAHCGTTTAMTQWDYRDYRFKNMRPPEINSLFVHWLTEEDNEIIWHTKTYIHTRRGFKDYQDGSIYSFRVWPRQLDSVSGSRTVV